MSLQLNKRRLVNQKVKEELWAVGTKMSKWDVSTHECQCLKIEVFRNIAGRTALYKASFDGQPLPAVITENRHVKFFTCVKHRICEFQRI